MNKLWVFGCSFSTGFRGNVKPYADEITWAGLLANKLGLELVNQGHAGQCNWVSILQFIDRRDEMQPGDVVVFEFTFFDRYNIYPTRAQLVDLEHFFISHKSSIIEMNIEYRNINLKWFEKQVINFLKNKNIQLYLWSAEGQLHTDFKKYQQLHDFIPAPNSTDADLNYSFFNKWQNNMDEQHAAEDDRHFNELGHERMANHLYNYIINNKQILI